VRFAAKKERASKLKKNCKTSKKNIITLGASAFSAEKFTFNHLADRFEKDCVKEAVFNDGVKVSGYKSSNSVKSYLKTLRAHLGGRELGKINYNDIKIFREKRLSTVSERTKRKISFAQNHRELATLSRVFNYAIENKWLRVNPMKEGKKLIQPNLETKRSRILTEVEEVGLLQFCTDERKHLLPILYIALDCGFRRNEILTLEWQDVMLEPVQIARRLRQTR